MAENQNTPVIDETAPAQNEKTFSQDEVNRLCAREAGKAQRAILRKLNLSSEDELSVLLDNAEKGKNSTGLQSQFDELNTKYSNAMAELNLLKNAKVLSKYGVTDDDMQEFYAYKIGKLVDDKKDFAAAAEEYFKDHPLNRGHVEVSTPGSHQHFEDKTNKRINDFIRRAGGFNV